MNSVLIPRYLTIKTDELGYKEVVTDNESSLIMYYDSIDWTQLEKNRRKYYEEEVAAPAQPKKKMLEVLWPVAKPQT